MGHRPSAAACHAPDDRLMLPLVITPGILMKRSTDRILTSHVGSLIRPPALIEFLSWDEQHFREFFRGTPIYRIKRRGFLRNVCVVLGNIGDTTALPTLERALTDPEPLVREHAGWAIEQIRSRYLGIKSAV